MKRILSILFAAAICLTGLGAAAQLNVQYTFLTQVGGTPITNAEVTLLPLGAFADYSGNVLSQAPSNLWTDTNGYVIFSNVVPGYSYQVTLSQPFGPTIRTNGFPTGLSGTVNGQQYGGVWNGQLFSWFYLTNGVAAGSTNVSVSSSNGVYYISVSPGAFMPYSYSGGNWSSTWTNLAFQNSSFNEVFGWNSAWTIMQGPDGALVNLGTAYPLSSGTNQDYLGYYGQPALDFTVPASLLAPGQTNTANTNSVVTVGTGNSLYLPKSTSIPSTNGLASLTASNSFTGSQNFNGKAIYGLGSTNTVLTNHSSTDSSQNLILDQRGTFINDVGVIAMGAGDYGLLRNAATNDSGVMILAARLPDSVVNSIDSGFADSEVSFIGTAATTSLFSDDACSSSNSAYTLVAGNSSGFVLGGNLNTLIGTANCVIGNSGPGDTGEEGTVGWPASTALYATNQNQNAILQSLGANMTNCFNTQVIGFMGDYQGFGTANAYTTLFSNLTDVLYLGGHAQVYWTGGIDLDTGNAILRTNTPSTIPPSGTSNTVYIGWETAQCQSNLIASNLVLHGPATVGNLTGATAVYADANKTLQSSSATATQLGYLANVTSDVQTQINAKGSVSSVGLSMPPWLTVSGSPVTGSGTLTASGNGNTATFAAVTSTNKVQGSYFSSSLPSDLYVSNAFSGSAFTINSGSTLIHGSLTVGTGATITTLSNICQISSSNNPVGYASTSTIIVQYVHSAGNVQSTVATGIDVYGINTTNQVTSSFFLVNSSGSSMVLSTGDVIKWIGMP